MKPIYPMKDKENIVIAIWPDNRVHTWDVKDWHGMNFTQSDAIEEFELGLPMIPNENQRVEPDYEVFGNKYVGLVITSDNPGEINNIATEISKAARSKNTWPLPLRGPVVMLSVEAWESLENNEYQ
tara:strand:- start:254 stop:631 length:378 start_codon:yes stop_codon:yes gene_type:complete